MVAAGICAWRRFGSGTYLHFDTMFGKARVYQVIDDEGEPVRLLEVGGIVHSGTYLDERYTELVFEYLKRYDILFDLLDGQAQSDSSSLSEPSEFPEKPDDGSNSNHFPDCNADRPKRICVLGCGGYDYPEHLIANHSPIIVDAVEIDPAITAIARRYFYLDRLIEEYETERTGSLNLICEDALKHLQTTDVRYDAIINDTFDAGTPPAHLTTREFAETVFARLVPGGLYLTNIVASLKGNASRFLTEQTALLRSVFADVMVLPCSTDSLTDPDNVIVVCRR